jgi:hypothetical protein
MASKCILILGNHPIAEEIARRHERLDSIVKRNRVLIIDGSTISHYDELYLLGENCDKNKTIAALLELAEENIIDNHSGNKLLCHLLVHDRKMLQMLKTCDPYGAVRRKWDVYPFSIEEIWSRSIVLDYKPITIHSDKHVHLVIFGMGEVAETVAIQAAHIAHYPNYVRDHSLRTRITLISEDAETLSEEIIKRYRHLFDNSYYRIVKPSEENAVRVFHKPMYERKREDFVDVEWEFVDAESWHPDVREKLKQWAQDDKQLLTVVMADSDENKNVAMSLFLPDELYQRSIPIHKYNPNAVEYDVTMPLVQMAKNVNYIYDRCYNDNFENWQGEILSSVEIDTEERERLWDKLSNIKRQSSIYNAITIPSKMRSIGLNEDDWDKFYDISQQDIEILAQVEHNRWNVEELILGYRPCTDEEQDKIAADVDTQKDTFKSRKIHYDLRAYNDLRPDKTGRSAKIYDLCLSAALPLIAKTFVDEKGGGA